MYITVLLVRCKCKAVWEVVQRYGRPSHRCAPKKQHIPFSREPSRMKRKSVPKLPLQVAPKQSSDVVDGLVSGERSRSPNSRYAVRSKWLGDASMKLSFDYTKSHTRHRNSTALPSCSSTVNTINDTETSNNNREHIPRIVYHRSFQARIARNYYKLQHTTLFVAFCINLLLLTAEVSRRSHYPVYHCWCALCSMMRHYQCLIIIIQLLCTAPLSGSP